jgi:ankyrin repeat protein
MLHHAARRGSLEALTKILELSPDLIYEKDVGSNTALHYAAMNGISRFI